MTIKAAAIIPAAGSGSRMKSSCPKQYLHLAGKPILMHSVSAFHKNKDIDRIVVVVAAERLDSTRELLDRWQLDQKAVVVEGGIRRQDSVKAGLQHLGDGYDIVLVHDGARPLISGDLIDRCIVAAAAHGAAIAAIPVKDTLKRSTTEHTIAATVDRNDLWQAQTPQAAKISLLRKAFDVAGDKDVTDEASLLELAGMSVHLVEGAETNIKITRPDDLKIAEKLVMKRSAQQIRVGHGYDAHRFGPQRKLVLGGVEIEHEQGLVGHSDADVATHALCDAILGALGHGDIGSHFPDSSAEYKNIYSIELLKRVIAVMRGDGFVLNNADMTIICQVPRLAPYISKMKDTLASACGVTPTKINIKATTTEKMGFTGREEGISTHAVVVITQN